MDLLIWLHPCSVIVILLMFYAVIKESPFYLINVHKAYLCSSVNKIKYGCTQINVVPYIYFPCLYLVQSYQCSLHSKFVLNEQFQSLFSVDWWFQTWLKCGLHKIISTNWPTYWCHLQINCVHMLDYVRTLYLFQLHVSVMWKFMPLLFMYTFWSQVFQLNCEDWTLDSKQ